MSERFLGAVVVGLSLVAGHGPAQEPRQPASSLPRWRDTTGMVFIRGGEFVREGKFKVHVRSFYMDQYEVTNEQYCAFLNADAAHARFWNDKQEIDNKGGRFVPRAGKERWPVYYVNVHDAEAYALWAGKRLPSESEWEWAAGGAGGHEYPWGKAPLTPARANFGNNVGHPRPVGSYPEGKSPLGLYDLVGNVAEWCLNDVDSAPKDTHVWRGGCWRLPAENQGVRARSPYKAEARVACVGFRCVRPTRRVLVLLGENFEEIELGAYTGVLSWAGHTKSAGNYVFRAGAPEVPNIEVVIAGFRPEVRGMGGTIVRPHVLVKDLKAEDLDGFDAVAIPACVGGARGQHTWQGRADLESESAIAVVRRVHGNGGIISTMCAGAATLQAAKLPLPKRVPGEAVAYDKQLRTATSAGPGVALEAACLLLKELVDKEEYRSFRLYNPWLFGGRDQFAPRVQTLK